MKQRIYSSLLVIMLAFSLTLSITVPTLAYPNFNSNAEVDPEGLIFEFIKATDSLIGPNQAFPHRRFVRVVHLGTEYAGFIPLVSIKSLGKDSGYKYQAFYEGHIPPYRPA